MAEIYQPDLKDDYYVANFHALAGFVASTYEDLLLPEELAWYDAICRASGDAQRLYIRLLTRKRSVFRVSRLNYREIPDIAASANKLKRLRLADSQPPVDLLTMMSCFTKPELLELLHLTKLRNLPRAALTERIGRSKETIQSQYHALLSEADQWITIKGHQIWMLMQLCFFGNLYQDSSEFVLRQLGALIYENYPLDQATRAFSTREQIEAHWRYFEAEALFENIDLRSPESLLQIAHNLPGTAIDDIDLTRRVDRLRNRIARQLERLKRYDDAKKLYEASRYPPAQERIARLLMRDQQWQLASELLDQMLASPYNEAEKLAAHQLQIKCRKALTLPVSKKRIFKPASSKLVLCAQNVRVEELARRYFAGKGVCFRTENTLVNGVLGLFIWDIIFHPLPGVFYNPFQAAPSDFNQPEFSQRRAAALHTRFSELHDQGKLTKRIQTAFQTHYGKQNPLVRWQGLTPELLVLAIERIPAAHWRALFTRILADPKENTAGFPDLVLFPENAAYEFIEIKGPGDTLQTNQRRWMHYFDEHSIPCRLVHIRYRNSKPLHAKREQ